MNYSTPDFSVLHDLTEFAQTHVHWVSDTIQPSHLLLSLHFLPSIFPSIRDFSNESVLHIKLPKYWSFSISSSSEYSELISFRIDWFVLLEVQGTLKNLLLNTTVQKHQFFGAQLSLWSNSHIQCRFAAAAAAAAAKSLQSSPTRCDPIDGSPPGSPIPGILQARTLEWIAISFSNAWKWKVKVKSLSRVWPSATPWTAAFQAPLSMGFSRQEYWSGVPLPSLEYTLRGKTNGEWMKYVTRRNSHIWDKRM